MARKDELLALMLRECDIAIHLHGKVPAGGMDFRFTPPQRSTAELLRYLSFIGLGACRSMLAGNWNAYCELEAAAAQLEPAGFPAAMERQKEGLRAFFAELTDEDLATRTFTQPWGEVQPLGQAITGLAYACLVAYRMQLFLHAKASGNASIGTTNCWGGADEPPAAG